MTNKTLFCPFYVSFCTFCASLWLKRTVFTRPKTSIISVNPVILSNFSPCLRAIRGEIIPDISVNPWLINDLRSTKDYVRNYKLFMQNKANFKKVKFDVTKVLTKDYDQMDTWSIRKNEPKTNPNEPKTNPILAKKTTQRTQTNPIQTRRRARSGLARHQCGGINSIGAAL